MAGTDTDTDVDTDVDTYVDAVHHWRRPWRQLHELQLSGAVAAKVLPTTGHRQHGTCDRDSATLTHVIMLTRPTTAAVGGDG